MLLGQIGSSKCDLAVANIFNFAKLTKPLMTYVSGWVGGWVGGWEAVGGIMSTAVAIIWQIYE